MPAACLQVSKVLVAYGKHVLSVGQVADVYADKYKGTWVCLQVRARVSLCGVSLCCRVVCCRARHRRQAQARAALLPAGCRLLVRARVHKRPEACNDKAAIPAA